MKKSISAAIAFMGFSALGIGLLAAPDPLRSDRPNTPGIHIDYEAIAALQSFTDCDEYLDWVKAAALERVGPWGLGGQYGGGIYYASRDSLMATSEDSAQSSAPQADGYSGTNNQVVGIDEPDIVKTDGTYIYTLAQGSLQIVDARSNSLVSSLDLGDYWPTDLLLDGDRALVSIAGYFDVPEQTASSRIAYWDSGTYSTLLIEIDLSDRTAPKIVERVKIDGGYVSSRIVDGVARIVVTADPTQTLSFVSPQALQTDVPIVELFEESTSTTDPNLSETEVTETTVEPVTSTTAPDAEAEARTLEKRAEGHNRVVIENSLASDWIPTWTRIDADGTELGAAQPLMGCEDASHTKEFAGFAMLTVLTVDLDEGLSAGLESTNAAGVLAQGATVYANAEHLYVAAYTYYDYLASDMAVATGEDRTDIHRFDISDPSDTVYEGSGTVAGQLLNQYAMDEFDDVLRVATTSNEWTNDTNTSDSAVTTLGLNGNELVQLGKVSGLGKGEQIRSVRFIDDTGYVVTFMQTDPLYTIDLRDPATPRVVGELKIPGYSGYLHPVGDGWLLGIGQDADADGRTKGMQVSLFDVRDPANPTRVAQYTAEDQSSSTVEWDAHAFTWWPTSETEGTAYVPFESWHQITGVSHNGVRILNIDVATGTITEVGVASHDEHANDASKYPYGYAPINRSVVIGENLWTLSEIGLMRTGLDGSGPETWINFPQGNPQVYPGGSWIE